MGGRDPAIEIDRFTMSFGRTTVVDDLSFRVVRGETFGFLGNNGSGKTATIRALLGIYQPTDRRDAAGQRARLHPAAGRRAGLPA